MKRAATLFIWWQGESDGLDGTSASEYRERLLTILLRVQERHPTPIMIVEMADHPTRMHLKAVQAELATHPLVALIPTAGLPMDGPHDFAPEAHQEVARRLMVCYFMECWRVQ